MKEILRFLMIAILICFFIYCMYWLAKNGSYFFFYEDMVKETIKEMVKPEYLR